MFYCEDCRVKNDWPESITKSHGLCELCQRTRMCHDTPSSALPTLPAPKIPENVCRWPDGEPMLVIRPKDAAQAVMLAKIALKHQSQEAMKAALEGEMTFLGYLVERDGDMFAVDEDGKNAVPIEEGDQFISKHELEESS